MKKAVKKVVAKHKRVGQLLAVLEKGKVRKLKPNDGKLMSDNYNYRLTTIKITEKKLIWIILFRPKLRKC